MSNITVFKTTITPLGSPPRDDATEEELWDALRTINGLLEIKLVCDKSGGHQAQVFYNNSTGSQDISVFAKGAGSTRQEALYRTLLEAIRLW